ncbi:MAG: hypothetical protein PHN72_02410 [Bacilli bacterium]|nr:hypothetical protein [Bacilli bacterium]
MKITCACPKCNKEIVITFDYVSTTTSSDTVPTFIKNRPTIIQNCKCIEAQEKAREEYAKF